jgi:phage terminase large subunit-like protein
MKTKDEDLGGPDIEKLQKAAGLLPVKERLEKYRAIDRIVLHPKQREFVDLLGSCSEAALLGANQSGKSTIGALIVAVCATGEYPPGWNGPRWDRPIVVWVLGPTAMHVRDVLQAKLVGNIADPDGLIPLDAYDDRHGRRAIAKSHGLPDAVDYIRIRHKAGRTSVIYFKSHEQGRERLQGAGVDLIWSDEDCPLSVWGELIARTISTQGKCLCTFTPMKGCLALGQRFVQEPSPNRGFVTMTLMDALHIPPERHQAIIDQIPEHERDARVYGILSAGAGKVFRTPEDQIAEELNVNTIPAWWTFLWGTDFGSSDRHPFAAVLGAYDRDADCIHIIHAIRLKSSLPRDHVAAMRPALNGNGNDIVTAWPHDGNVRSFESMRTTAEIYRKEGQRMMGTHATLPRGGFDTEAGVALMAQRFRDGRLKVARHLSDWFSEYRAYHRKEDGLINKINDDLMSATRILVMQIRSAKEIDDHRPGFDPNVPYRRPQGPQGGSRFTRGTDENEPIDVFTGRPLNANTGRAEDAARRGQRGVPWRHDF